MTAPTTSTYPRGSPARLWLDLSALLDPAGLGLPTPRLDAADWLSLYRFAGGHLVAPMLAAVLARRGWPPGVPTEVRDALEALRWLNADRNRRLRELLRETTRLLNAVGIVPLPLKGALALLPGAYPDAGDRILGDLDIAVEPERLPAAINALRAAGYRLPANLHPSIWRKTGHYHAPPLAEPSGYGYVELHHALHTEPPTSRVLALTSVMAAATALDWEGVALRVPTLAHRLVHNSLHHQIHDRAFRTDRRSLRQHLEFAQMRGLPGATALDWPALLAALDEHAAGDALRLDLLATQTLFGVPLPAGVRPSPAALAAEGRFWWWRNNPRANRWLAHWQSAVDLGCRLRNLPRRLVDPYWYPAKWHELRHHWFSPPVDLL